jgi:hypothetical protein
MRLAAHSPANHSRGSDRLAPHLLEQQKAKRKPEVIETKTGGALTDLFCVRWGNMATGEAATAVPLRLLLFFRRNVLPFYLVDATSLN